MFANLNPAIAVLIAVALLTLAVAWRAIKNGKVGPEYGLSLEGLFAKEKDKTPEQDLIELSMTLSEPQLYALLNALIDEVGQDEQHLLEPVLNAVGNVVAAREQASGILP